MIKKCEKYDIYNDKWIEISIAEVNSYWEISVTDSGKGIPENMRGKIVEPFYTTKPSGKGTGLGLSISKRILEDHGGKLDLDEDAGPPIVVQVAQSGWFSKPWQLWVPVVVGVPTGPIRAR